MNEQTLFSHNILNSVAQRAERLKCRLQLSLAVSTKQSRWMSSSSVTKSIHGLCLDDNKIFRSLRSSSSFWSGRALSKCNSEVHKDIMNLFPNTFICSFIHWTKIYWIPSMCQLEWYKLVLQWEKIKAKKYLKGLFPNYLY